MLELVRTLAAGQLPISVFVPLPDVGKWPGKATGVAVERSPNVDDSVALTTSATGHGAHRLHNASYCARVASRESSEVDAADVLDRLLMVAAGASVADISASDDRLATAEQALRRDGAMPLDESVATLGLWPRWHRRPVMTMPAWGVVNTTNWSMYWFAARAAIPSAWRYVGSCMEAERAGKGRLGELAMSAVVRLHRALRARDEIHWVAWGAPETDAREELLYHLDVFLLMLSAAFDTTARSTFLIYGLGTNPRGQSWNRLLSEKGKSLQALQQSAPELIAAMTRDGAKGRRRLIALLRNSIHEAPLLGVSSTATSSISVAVPPHLTEPVLEAASAGGSPEEFGLRQDAGAFQIELGRFVEAMMRHALRDIDEQMAATDLGRLAVGDHGPPTADDATFGVEASFSTLALMGLTADVNQSEP